MMKESICFLLMLLTTVFSYRSETICMHSRENEEMAVECQPGESCYAIASAYYHKNNGTWGLRKYALGCWETTPDCTENECLMPTPDYIWVDHHFPRFCCCKGNLCNRNLKLFK
uniref:Uncharacterized protein n=1 Tax=Clytia hemisphaerica TaxID=252671 RepID=A0A7M5WWS9_9CNID